uniref:Uncharacterized protein n=1 Tax=Yersinia enterocolitica W22703 TaxID=913028 RepID=F4N0Y1_YEREN|nr:unknown protein [Yersinia enterocolitica W22703]
MAVSPFFVTDLIRIKVPGPKGQDFVSSLKGSLFLGSLVF